MSPRIVTIQIIIMSVFLGLTVAIANAAPGKRGSQMMPTKSVINSKLSTDIHFDGVNVGGRRQAPFEASAVVENEKGTPSLIDYRSNYDDRIQRSQSGR